MTCPYCNGSTSVTNSRSSSQKQAIWRRRKCKNCQAIWSTRENYDLSTTHRVKSHSTDVLKPFNRDLILLSVNTSLNHLKQSSDVAGDLTDTIISKLIVLKKPIINTSDIIEITTKTLHSYNPTASSVYSAIHS